ncbi:hypothetical protein [Lacunimicrobium album]
MTSSTAAAKKPAAKSQPVLLLAIQLVLPQLLDATLLTSQLVCTTHQLLNQLLLKAA